MGWSNGSTLMSELIDVVRKEIPNDKTRFNVYLRMIDVFEDTGDCDTLHECLFEDTQFDHAFVKSSYLSDNYYRDDMMELFEMDHAEYAALEKQLGIK